MKKYLFIALLFVSCGRKHVKDGDTVYICLSPTAHAYHSSERCNGLQRCTHEIEPVSFNTAVAKGKTPCHYCCK